MVLDNIENSVMNELDSIFNACDNAAMEVDNINYGDVEYVEVEDVEQVE